MQLKLRTVLLPFFVVAFTFFTSWAQAQTVNAYADAGLTLPTVSSDKDDYAPGEVAHIRGTGWTLDDTVDVHFEEDPYHEHDHEYHGIVVNKDGTWQIDYPIEERHLGVRFTVHVEGKQSGYEGFTIFYDANVNFNSSGLPFGSAVSITARYRINGGAESIKAFTYPGPSSIPNIAVQSGQTITVTFDNVNVGGIIYSAPSTSFTSNNNGNGVTTLSALYSVAPKVNPTITWSNPSNITYGTTLSGTQLNATADVPGTFAYSPAAGSILNAGTSQTLSVTFTPANSTNYNTVNKSVTINVDKANQVISWNNPSPITYGTVLDNNLLNATVTTGNGGLTYNPVSGTKLDAGTYTLSVAAAETDNYKSATKTVSLTVNKATPDINWTNPASIEYGTLLGTTQLNATAGGVAGTFSYTPVAGTLLNAGNGQTLTTSFVPTETKNYNTPVDKTVTINVAKANATVTVNGYSGVYDAVAHSATGSATGINGTDVSSGLSLGSTFTDAPGGIASWTFNNWNYNPQSGTVNIIISKAPVTLSFGNLVFDYDGAEKTATATASPSVSGVVVSGAGTNAGEYAAAASLENTNYEAAPITGTLKINKVNATINVSGYTGRYDGTSHGATGTAKDLNGDDLSGFNLGNSFKDYPGGTANWSFPGNTNYLPASGSVDITISKATPSISLVVGGPYVYNGSAQGVQSATVSGVTVNSVAENLGNATVTYSGSSTAPSNAGSYNVLSSFAGNNNYTAAVDQSGTLLINKATATINLSGLSQTFDGNAKNVTVSTSPANLIVNTTYAGLSQAPTNAGSYAIASTINDNNYEGEANGTLIIDKALTTTAVFVNNTTYTGDAQGGTAAVSGVAGLSQSLTLSYVGTSGTTYGPSATAPTNAGSYIASATYAGSENYLASADTKGFIIGKANATISITPYSDVYDGQSHTASGTAKGVKNEDLGASLNFATNYTNVPGGATNWAFSGGNNYNDDNGIANVVILKANQTINWTAPSNITYPAAIGATQLNATASGVAGGSAPGLLSYNPVSGSVLNAGTHTLIVTAAETSNYNSATQSVSLTVNKGTPTITWSNPNSITYGTALSNTQLNASANIAGSFVYTPAVAAHLNAGDDQSLSVVFTPTDADNYSSASGEVKINVEKADPTISVNGYNGTYDGAAHGATLISATGGYGQDLSGNVVLGNTFTNVPGSTAHWSYAGDNNHNAANGDVSITIGKANASVTPANNNKVYGDADPVLSGILSGFVAIDNIAASYIRVAGESVTGGPYTISASLSPSAALGNYNIDYKTGIFNITARPITIKADAKSKVYGNADPDWTTQISSGSIVGPDKPAGSLIRTPGENVGKFAIQQGTFTYGSNYKEIFEGSDLTITKRPITLTIEGKNKVYGESDPQFTLQITSGDIVGPDKPTGNLTRVSGENVGNYQIQKGAYSYGSNYEEQFVNANLTITQRSITITADNKAKYCGQSDPALTYLMSSALVTGDQCSGTLSRASGEATGIYNINKGTLSINSNYDISFIPASLTINGVSVDASASSTPVPSTATSITLSAKVAPAVPGVSVVFYKDGVAIGTGLTDINGIANYNITSGLAVDVYQIKAATPSECAQSTVYLPVYDPNAGFVTGGGWINSPAGAYVADASLTGKANFGFVSKYKKGSTQVDGSTEFQFHAGSLNFKSLLHESGSLVIAGAKAMYKGAGTVNGVSGYNFMVSAIDGGYNGGTSPDKFRIKIWNTTTSAIIYDNQVGSDDNASLSEVTVLGGGSIVIQQTTTKKSEIVTTQVAEQAPAMMNFGLSVLPNPTTSTFNVKVESNNATEKISLKVVDMYGRTIQLFNNLQNGQSLQLGNTYRPGVYIVEMMQGNNRKQLKVIKQNN